MTIKTLFAATAALLAGFANAQSGSVHGHVAERIAALRGAGVQFKRTALLQPLPASTAEATWTKAVQHATVLRLDAAARANVLAERPAFLAMELPSEEGPLTLDLERVDIGTDDLSVVVASTGAPIDYTPGAHYRGSVHGDAGSVVAISVFEDEVMGLITDGTGDRVLGRFEAGGPAAHILYRADALKDPARPTCGTLDNTGTYTKDDLIVQPHTKSAKCVRLYWEVNHDIFQGKGGTVNATNYVTGLFNQSATLYANDGISVALSEVYVWDVASPYTATSTSALLDQFGTTRTSFNGDLANLLGYAGGGGIAWLNGICSGQTRYKMAYSGISSGYNTVPAFSWSVEVVTHEQGHLMGSRHTHACAWNGNNTAIDGCGPAAGYTEGSCATAAVPSSSVGGTIMSYCHLTNSGIKFANGFGPQPLAVILNKINSASCLGTCAATSCGTPSGLASSAITTSSATLAWTAVPEATSYTVQWKRSSASTWTTVSGLITTAYALTGLQAGTAHSFQVQAVCASGASAFATAASFTTTATATCGAPATPTASGVSTAGATLNWSAVNGAVSYTLRYKRTTATTWTTLTAITGTSRALTGLTAGTAYEAQVLTVCASGSSAYSASRTFTTTATGNCGTPGGLAAGAITANAATMTWNAVSGAQYYNLRYKPSTSDTWTMVTNITTTSRTVSGLSASSSYDVRVLSVCASGSSTYAPVVTFTTAATGCSDSFEPNNSLDTPRGITANSTLTAAIGTSGDLDWYKFSNAGARPNIRIRLEGLPANYDLRLYRGSTLLATSQNSGTASETIVYNTSTLSNSYLVRVSGANGAFSAGQCYRLIVETGTSAFATPEGAVEAAGPEGEVAVEIHPNPASEQLNIVLPASATNTTVELLDGCGRVVRTLLQGGIEVPTTLRVDVGDRPAGMYLVRVLQGEASTVRRVIIAH